MAVGGGGSAVQRAADVPPAGPRKRRGVYKRERGREGGRETVRQTDRQTDRQAGRQTDRDRDRQRDRQAERKTRVTDQRT